MKVFVEELAAIIGGAANGAAGTNRRQDAPDEQRFNTASADTIPAKPASFANKGKPGTKTASADPNGRPECVIPFDDDRVSDF
jgi:hypothetical protein